VATGTDTKFVRSLVNGSKRGDPEKSLKNQELLKLPPWEKGDHQVGKSHSLWKGGTLPIKKRLVIVRGLGELHHAVSVGEEGDYGRRRAIKKS